MTDDSFRAGDGGLDRALALLRGAEAQTLPSALPGALPEIGVGEQVALETLAPQVLGRAAELGAPGSFAHMDPPTPWITWALTLWNASLNQNLLHPATAPFAREAEARVVDWLAPFFGMEGGHFCAGSSLANLTALWAARDGGGVRRVVASEAAHLSIRKAAQILGVPFIEVPVDARQQIDRSALGDLSDACLVLTAGTTSAGAIDPLDLSGAAAWTHIDAAWAGPLRLSTRHSDLLDGVERADSVAISAHKWLFQPKDSALVLFRDVALANAAISFGGGYLAAPNIGVQGSRGAAAVPLLGTLMAWGRQGVAARIEHALVAAGRLAEFVDRGERYELWAPPVTGIVNFRAPGQDTDALAARMPDGMVSVCTLSGQRWLRCVAANPMADIGLIESRLEAAVRG